MKTMIIKANNAYVSGVVGNDFTLTFGQKLKLLFCKKLTVVLVGNKIWREGKKPVVEITKS